MTITTQPPAATSRPTVSSLAPSLIRTAVPFVVGVAGAYGTRYLGLTTDQETQLVTAGLGFGYYLLVRLLEARWPRLGVFLGVPAAPTYPGELQATVEDVVEALAAAAVARHVAAMSTGRHAAGPASPAASPAPPVISPAPAPSVLDYAVPGSAFTAAAVTSMSPAAPATVPVAVPVANPARTVVGPTWSDLVSGESSTAGTGTQRHSV